MKKIVLLLFIIFLFYFFIGSSAKFRIDFSIKDRNVILKKANYNYLVDAFLAGHLNLPIKAPTGLLSLSNPYDPIENKLYREESGLHDTSLYKGKLYLYFGPAPALFFYLPYHLLTKRYAPDNLAVLLFAYGGFIWVILILGYLKKYYFKEIPEWIFLLSICILGFSNGGAFILRRTEIYEVAISCGYFFLTGAIYLILISYKENKYDLKILTLISLFLALASASRLNFIPSSFFLLIWLSFVVLGSSISLFSRIKSIVLIVFPYLICLLLLAFYNYYRFESFTEFGGTYQLSSADFSSTKILSLDRVFINIYNYTLRPFALSAEPPFIYLKTLTVYDSRMSGVFPTIPVSLMIIIVPIFYFLVNGFERSAHNLKRILFPYFEFLIIFFIFLINLILLLTHMWVTYRYIVDIATYLILLSLIVFFYFDLLLTNMKLRNFLRGVYLFLSFTTIFLAIIFSLTGESFTLENHRNKFKKLDFIIVPISKMIFTITKGKNYY